MDSEDKPQQPGTGNYILTSSRRAKNVGKSVIGLPIDGNREDVLCLSDVFTGDTRQCSIDQVVEESTERKKERFWDVLFDSLKPTETETIINGMPYPSFERTEGSEVIRYTLGTGPDNKRVEIETYPVGKDFYGAKIDYWMTGKSDIIYFSKAFEAIIFSARMAGFPLNEQSFRTFIGPFLSNVNPKEKSKDTPPSLTINYTLTNESGYGHTMNVSITADTDIAHRLTTLLDGESVTQVEMYSRRGIDLQPFGEDGKTVLLTVRADNKDDPLVKGYDPSNGIGRHGQV